MVHLTKASQELFRREPDEIFSSIDSLVEHCRDQRETSVDQWLPPATLSTKPVRTDQIVLSNGDDTSYFMNDWSFGQLCRLAGVTKETVNRLSSETAARVFGETLPRGNKPLQVLVTGDRARAIHGASYTRLFNSELLDSVLDIADGFEPPPEGLKGATGLYCGEQDMFCFLIDPGGWTEIGGEAFAPGFFLWNSEVGRRSLGIQTFWFQAVCKNHLVWDAVEVVEFKRKHTANVHDSLVEIQRIVGNLVARRDERRDGFARAIDKAMQTQLGDDADEVQKILRQRGINAKMAREAMDLVEGRFTIFAIVDALTRLAGRIRNAGDRFDVDQRAGSLLALAV